jgi:O-antigen/teichoic acid export membrane protein
VSSEPQRAGQESGPPARPEGAEGLLSRLLAALLARGLSLAFAFGLHLLLARTLGLEAYGAWSLVTTWALLLGPLCALGLDQTAPRFVAVLAAQGEWALLRGFLRRSVQVALGTAALTGLVVAAALWAAGPRLEPALGRAALAGLPLLGALPLLYLAMSALRGARRAALADVLGVVVPAALTMVALPGLVRCGLLAPAAPAALGVYAGAVLLAALLGGLLLRRALPRPTWSARPAHADRAWLDVSLPALGGLLTGYALTHTDLLVLGALGSVEQVGLYAAAARLSRLLASGLVAVESVVAPSFAELHARGEGAGLARVARAAAWAFLVIGVGGGAVVLGAREPLLAVFGPGFRAASPALGLLVLGQVASGLCGPVRCRLLMTGHERAVARLSGLAAATNLALNLLLVPAWGIVGAAAATSAATVLNDLLLLGYARRASS